MEISTRPYIKSPELRESKHTLVIKISVNKIYLGEVFVCSGSYKDLEDIVDGTKELRDLL